MRCNPLENSLLTGLCYSSLISDLLIAFSYVFPTHHNCPIGGSSGAAQRKNCYTDSRRRRQKNREQQNDSDLKPF